MTTIKRRACSEHALASGAWRRGAARWGYGVTWAGLTLLTATLSAAPGPFTFNPAPGSPFPAGDGPDTLALGDVNGNGRPDLAVVNRDSDSVRVLLGNGDGTFGAAGDFAVGDGPESVAIGDVDGNGRPDLAVGDGAPRGRDGLPLRCTLKGPSTAHGWQATISKKRRENSRTRTR